MSNYYVSDNTTKYFSKASNIKNLNRVYLDSQGMSDGGADRGWAQIARYTNSPENLMKYLDTVLDVSTYTFGGRINYESLAEGGVQGENISFTLPKSVWKDYAEYLVSSSPSVIDVGNNNSNVPQKVKWAVDYLNSDSGEVLTLKQKKKDAGRIIEAKDGKANDTILRENLKNCLNSMTEIMSQDAHYVPFVVFKLIGYNIINGKQVKTTEYIIDGRENKNNISQYFQYKRNGTGRANELSIVLVFSPHERAKSLLDFEHKINPNSLEIILTQLCIAKKDASNKDISDEKLSEMLDSTLWSCKMQVGYSVDGKEDIVSPEYDTMITDYKSEFQNNQIIYTIQCVSSILQAKTLIDLKQPKFEPTQEPIEAAIGFMLRNLNEDRFYFSSGSLPNGKSIFTKIKDLANTESKYDKNSVVVCGYTRNFAEAAKYKLDIIDQQNLSDEERKEATQSEEAGTTYDLDKILNEGLPKGNKEEPIFNIVQRLLSYAILKDSYLKDNWKGRFEFTVSDNVTITGSNTSKSLITIQYVNEIEDFSPQTNIDSTYSFQWLDTPTPSSLVENFKIDASGAHIKAAINDNVDKLLDDIYFVDNDGNSQRLSRTDSDIVESGEYAPWYKVVRDYLFREALMNLGNYVATLTLPGVPAEIPILTTFEINVYMNGEKHFSSGYYRVTATEDVLDTSGYRTSLTLLKLTENIDVDKVILKINKLVSDMFPNSNISITNESDAIDSWIKSVKKDKALNNTYKKQYEKYKKEHKGKDQSYDEFLKTKYKESHISNLYPNIEHNNTKPSKGANGGAGGGGGGAW